jgi:hypothetical protein
MNDWLWDRVLIPFVTRVPGWVVGAAALLFYPGIGLALPLMFGWPRDWLFAVNVWGVMLAALLSVGYLAVLVQAKDRRHLLEWTSDLRLLTAEEFEFLVGELFRREGWAVTETGRQDGPDGNIDLVLKRGRDRRIVQCKRWTSWQVGVKEIRAFAGTLMREGADGKDGIFVTLSDFGVQALEEAAKTRITLIDRTDLFNRVEKVRRQEPCPICERPMLFDRSPHGWWFRCVAEGCAGKRDLGADAGRAVELLTDTPTLSHTKQDPA